MLGKSTLQSAFAHWKKITRASKEGLEVWAPVGESHYSISSYGNVKNNSSGKAVKGYSNSRGYKQVGLSFIPMQRRSCKVHRLVATAFVSNPDKKVEVDHIDNDKTNNRASNLRYATRSENMMNTTIYKNNKSGVIGVALHKRDQKWMAHIRVDTKRINLGYFNTREEAILARVKASNELFGAFNHLSQKT